MVAQTRPATLEDLAATPDDGRTYEIIDGEIVVSAAPTFRHQLVSQLMNRSFLNWIGEHEVGLVLTAPVDVVLNTGQTFQPDLLFIADANSGEVIDGRFHGAPDLVVEIVSPTSRSRDSFVKPMRYARFGVREFWLIDPDLRTVSAYDLADGLYHERTADEEGALASGVMDGLRVDSVALFSELDRLITRGRPGG